MMAELLAKETGYCRGRGGSMHIADVDTGNLGANGIVGGGIPIAVGAALAQQLQRRRTRSWSASSATAPPTRARSTRRSNLAAVWELPVVFVCENNKYGMSMASDRGVRDREHRRRAPRLRHPRRDASTATTCRRSTRWCTTAVDRARAGGGPTLVENVTYRWKGHSKSDKNLYRTREEIAAWQERDPITRFEEAVREAGSLTDEEIQAARKAATDAMRDADPHRQRRPAGPGRPRPAARRRLRHHDR